MQLHVRPFLIKYNHIPARRTSFRIFNGLVDLIQLPPA
jgi:hypothetical protein